jgi:hypothetical protein
LSATRVTTQLLIGTSAHAHGGRRHPESWLVSASRISNLDSFKHSFGVHGGPFIDLTLQQIISSAVIVNGTRIDLGRRSRPLGVDHLSLTYLGRHLSQVKLFVKLPLILIKCVH